MVFYGPFVYPTVILDGAEFSVFLFDEEEWGGIWTFRGADVPFLQVFLDELL